jgi:hypothetical protein
METEQTEVFKSCDYDPIGCTLNSIELNSDGKMVLQFADATLVLGCEGDCCAHAYFSDLEVASDLPARTIEWNDSRQGSAADIQGYVPGEYEDAHDIQFIKIRTDKGYIDFNLHTEHNGYYGGWYFVERIDKHE